MWPEVQVAKTEKRREILLTGTEISKRIDKDGFDCSVFTLKDLNLLSITSTNLAELPEEISKLVNLQNLILHSNRLKTINNGLEKLTAIKLLDLSDNELETVPESIENLTQIVTFNFANNKLTTFPVLTNNSKLSVIDLSNNKLKLFPDVCKEALTNLSEIKLRGNEIEELPNTISSLPALKVLDISENKIKIIPGELADCAKLKEINLKSNPISDRRLLKLIDQCRTKQILDYVKLNCARTSAHSDAASKKGKKGKNHQKSENSEEHDESSVHAKFTITVKHATDDCKVIMEDSVKSIREHITCCLVNNITFTEETFKKFIQLQNKLHDGLCEKRNSATIATHDFNKLGKGNLTYTTCPPNNLLIKPLNRPVEMTGAELFTKLQAEANNLRKEKKRNTYSGIHKYLYLIEGKAVYPCLMNAKNEVVSFPPITNSDISKIELTSTNIFIEVTSSISQFVCKNVLNELFKEMTAIFEKVLEVQQVKVVDKEDHLKVVYPSKTDLNFDKNVPIKIVRQ